MAHGLYSSDLGLPCSWVEFGPVVPTYLISLDSIWDESTCTTSIEMASKNGRLSLFLVCFRVDWIWYDKDEP